MRARAWGRLRPSSALLFSYTPGMGGWQQQQDAGGAGSHGGGSVIVLHSAQAPVTHAPVTPPVTPAPAKKKKGVSGGVIAAIIVGITVVVALTIVYREFTNSTIPIPAARTYPRT